MAREVARQQRAAATAQRRAIADEKRQIREEQALVRASIRDQKEWEREQARRHIDRMEQEAKQRTRDAASKLMELEGVLAHTLDIDDTISFDALRVKPKVDVFYPPSNVMRSEPKPLAMNYHEAIPKPSGFLAKLTGANTRYEAAFDAAKRRFEEALSKWHAADAQRLEEIERLKAEHGVASEAAKAKADMRNAEVNSFEAEYFACDPDAVVAYNTMVLERSEYPEDFPQKFSIAYTEASKMLVIEYELPPVSVIPAGSEYRYVRTRDLIDEKLRKPADIRAIYQDLIASLALRTMHEVFEADQAGAIEVVCFNGFIHSVDPATGRDTQPHLVSVRTSKEQFMEINLAKVDRAVCLRNLGAQVSRSASEAQPVRPIVEFDMADARFIDQTDLVSGLSNAQNLMDLTPGEFEVLVANLFGQMGLDSKLTRTHRDGGVDCIAFDPRPILGGKVVIQAKRYKNTVGVSAVRDLYGTMMNEGASKGILVTTSGYGPDAFSFASDKPIELVDGGGLLFLLQDIGIQARIIFAEGT